MKYNKIIEAKFIDRPNRFIANVIAGGAKTSVHVKNTGRCREILVKDATVYLEDFSENMGTRKYAHSLVGVLKEIGGGEKVLINMDSQAPNKVVYEALRHRKIMLKHMDNPDIIKPEAAYGDSRLDFYIKDSSGKEGYIEVKGVTLENDGVASFPDAPTQRGIKHLEELINLTKKGYCAYVIFVIQMKEIKYFTPNEKMHKEFAITLKKAKEEGVNILAYNCHVTPDSLEILNEIPIKL